MEKKRNVKLGKGIKLNLKINPNKKEEPKKEENKLPQKSAETNNEKKTEESEKEQIGSSEFSERVLNQSIEFEAPVIREENTITQNRVDNLEETAINAQPAQTSTRLNPAEALGYTSRADYSTSKMYESTLDPRPGYESETRSMPIIADRESLVNNRRVFNPFFNPNATLTPAETVERRQAAEFARIQEEYRVKMQEESKLPFQKKSKLGKTEIF